METIRINENIWRVEDGGVRFYLFCGTEKAALIDSGMTTANAKEIAEGLTDLPLILVNTHADPDHIAGNGAFPEIYMSAAEKENYRAHKGQGSLIPIQEGDIIDLGGRTLRVIDIPGHTPGSIALLDEKERVLISGDSVQDDKIFMFVKFRDLNRYIESLEHLSAYDGTYDVIYPMHGTFPVMPDLIQKLSAGAREIRDGRVSGVPVDMFGQKVCFYKFPYAGFLCDF